MKKLLLEVWFQYGWVGECYKKFPPTAEALAKILKKYDGVESDTPYYQYYLNKMQEMLASEEVGIVCPLNGGKVNLIDGEEREKMARRYYGKYYSQG